MKLEDVRVGMILRDRGNFNWTVVGIDDGTLRAVSVVTPTRITCGVKPDMLDPVPSPPVEEPEPEAEPEPKRCPKCGLDNPDIIKERNSALKERDDLKAKLDEALSTIRVVKAQRDHAKDMVDNLQTKLSASEKRINLAKLTWLTQKQYQDMFAMLDKEFGGKP